VPTTVENQVAELQSMRDAHFAVAQPLMGKGYKYTLDIFALAVLDRSLSLLRGFCDLVAAKNMIAAAPLIRCQLDNGLRFFASTLVADPHDFAGKIAKGIGVRRIKDRNGNRMLDSYLVDKLTLQASWTKSLYDQASGYVHLSEQHIINTTGIPDEEGNTIIKVTGYDGSVWTEQRYSEAIEAFGYSTKLVLELVEGWSQARREPQIAARAHEQ